MFKRLYEREKVFLFWSFITLVILHFLYGSPAIAADKSEGDLKSPGPLILLRHKPIPTGVLSFVIVNRRIKYNEFGIVRLLIVERIIDEFKIHNI